MNKCFIGKYYDKNPQIIHIISESEVTAIIKAINQIEDYYRQYFNPIKICKGNIDDYFEYILHLRELIKADFNNFLIKRTELELETSRKLMSVLDSISVFKSVTKRSLSTRFSGSKDIPNEFLKKSLDLETKSFSYKFISRLRDYGHHCSLPWVSPESTTISIDERNYTFKMLLDKQKLLEDSKMKSIGKEFNNLPDKIEIDSMINESYIELKKLHSFALSKTINRQRINYDLLNKIIGQDNNIIGWNDDTLAKNQVKIMAVPITCIREIDETGILG